MLGFVKKVLVADAVAPIADGAFALGAPTAAEAWLGVLAFAVQLLFDFSGYSDMAIGLGRMLGFRFPENFLRPYRARSVTEFWRRWHVSPRPGCATTSTCRSAATAAAPAHLRQPRDWSCCWRACGTAPPGPSSCGARGTPPG
jgi:hypothetical protein